jgi:hypothetical protein
MICRRCNRVMAGDKISIFCSACIERASHEAFIQMQRLVLPRFISGEYPLTFGAVNANHYAHIQLIGEPTHAWCGERMSGKRYQKPFAFLDRTADLCPRCESAIRDMAKELEKSECRSS